MQNILELAVRRRAACDLACGKHFPKIITVTMRLSDDHWKACVAWYRDDLVFAEDVFYTVYGTAQGNIIVEGPWMHEEERRMHPRNRVKKGLWRRKI